MEGRITTPPTLSGALISLFALRKQLHDPYSQLFHVHVPLLVDTKAAITSLVLQGTSLHFRKVKSHIGIIGNQCADELAKKLRTVPLQNLTCQVRPPDDMQENVSELIVCKRQ
jgi:hypothetical protein